MNDRVIASIPNLRSEERAKLRANCEAALNAPKRSEAAAAVLAALNAFEARQERELQAKLSTMTVTERIAQAFREKPMSKRDERVIVALLRHPGSTSAELSIAAGWSGSAWHLHFGTMCKERRHLLWPGPASEVRDAEFYSGILAEIDIPTGAWRMKAEAISAFQQLGIPSGQMPPG